MANIKSSKKRALTNEKARQRNIAVRSKLRTYEKLAETALETKDADTIKKALSTAISQIDRATSKGVLHPKAAARRKSSLDRRANSATS